AFSVLMSYSAFGHGWLAIFTLVGATTALTIGELWHSSGAWELSLTLAPPDTRGRFLTVFNLGATVLDITGAVIVTSWVLPAGTAGWFALGSLLALTGLVTPPVARWAEREAAQQLQPA
ncbi:MAG: MFS transporter, partial [Micromonosporaceae bacterium]